MNLMDLIYAMSSNIWIFGGSLVLILGILVFVHEWGHYIVARMCGVQVEIFSVGFGKEIFGFNDRNGTRWKISLVPLGGYVKLFGDTNPASAGHTDMVKLANGFERPMTAKEKEQAFYLKPVWKRAAVVFAGPAINFIFAILVFTGLYSTYGQPYYPASAAAIVAGSNADKFGFKPHDMILSIDGKPMNTFMDIRREIAVSLDTEKLFKIKRGEEIIELKAHAERKARTDRFGFKSEVGVLGLVSAEEGLQAAKITKIDDKEYSNSKDVIAEIQKRMGTTFKVEIKRDEKNSDVYLVSPVKENNQAFGLRYKIESEFLFLSKFQGKQIRNHTPMTALQSALQETYNSTVMTMNGLWQIIIGVRSTNELGGIIRIGAIAGDMAQQGIVPFIALMALLSINLGFINLLPIPVLDGGHLTFYLAESILGRPVPEKFQEYAFNVGFFFLIGVMAFANLNDLWQLFIHNKG